MPDYSLADFSATTYSRTFSTETIIVSEKQQTNKSFLLQTLSLYKRERKKTIRTKIKTLVKKMKNENFSAKKQEKNSLAHANYRNKIEVKKKLHPTRKTTIQNIQFIEKRLCLGTKLLFQSVT